MGATDEPYFFAKPKKLASFGRFFRREDASWAAMVADKLWAMTKGGNLRLGVDLGGTKMEAVVLRLDGESFEVLARLRRPTDRALGYDHIIDALCGLIHDTAAQAGLAELPPIGIGMPGSISRRSGLTKNSNTTCLNGRPFRADVIAKLGQPVRFANDANCFALSEARFGAGRGHRVVFGVILGTGVGGGLVFPGADGRADAWDGPQGIAGEWGHVSLEPKTGPACYCGRRGCIETFLCGPAIESRYVERCGSPLSLPQIAERVAVDAVARQVCDAHVAMFGRAIATVINIVDPDVIVLGGGVSNLPWLYTDGVTEAAKWVFSDELTTPIAKHQLGDSAGVIGAALLP